MPPADAPDARPHERAFAENLTGASLLRTRNVDNTEKRVEKAETRSETRSAAARPWSAPDAQEPPPARVSAKHASTRRPGAILRAAERLVLAAAVEDAAVSDAIENDGSLDQPPGGSDDTRIEAAAFRKLVNHLREHTEVQNIDLMNLAGFCRNCLSKWYRAEAAERGFELSDPDAREIIYGMPYEEWKARYQQGPKQDHKA